MEQNLKIQTLKTARAAGDRFYFTGKPCCRGHIGLRLTAYSMCYECHLANRPLQSKRYRARHPRKPRDRQAIRIYNATRYAMLAKRDLDVVRPLLGCTPRELRAFIQAKWEPGMNWNNYGKLPNQWQVDHIIALSKFNLKDPDSMAAAAHFSNIQPLWSRANNMKH